MPFPDQTSKPTFFVGLNENPPENNCRPSVDVLFRSVSTHYGNNVLAVIMTGMGDDGCRGVGAVKRCGGEVIAESEETAVIFGMPQQAIRSGSVDHILPLNEIPTAIQSRLTRDSENVARRRGPQ